MKSTERSEQAPQRPVVNFVAAGEGRFFDIFMTLFVALLLISNISATKLIGGPWGLIFDGGAVMFPFTYILGDILSEVYGFRGARRAVLTGFGISILASALFFLVAKAPPASGDFITPAFSQVFGFVPRIVTASLVGYVLGQLLNALVLVRIKGRTGERFLWIRMIASTLVGELVDTLAFCTIAFAGLISGPEFFNYVLTGYVYKCALEIIMSPLSIQVIGWVKRGEKNYVPIDTELPVAQSQGPNNGPIGTEAASKELS